MATNYDDVVDQMTAFGLQVDHLQVGRMIRCKVEGDREKRGWYILHELVMDGGDVLLVGSYGVWRGSDNHAQKVELRKRELSQEQRDSLRRRLAEDRKRADRARKAEAERAAVLAAKTWAKCATSGESEYLVRKGVGAHGVRFSPSGAMVIPLTDATGKIHGLEIIRGKQPAGSRKLDKEFWPAGLAKKGHFHLLGGMPTSILLVAEGYATAATLHEATGLPVAVAFDAGNLAPVCAALHKRYKRARLLVCADDDAFGKCVECKAPVTVADGADCPACGKPHGRSNAGVTAASAAAMEVGGAIALPVFSDEADRAAAFHQRGHKFTDYNDLHTREGLHVVRAQIEARLGELGWHAATRSAGGAAPRGEGKPAKDKLRAIETLDELLERYALVYGQGGTVFDHVEHMLMALSDMRDACVSRELHRAWAEHPDKQLVRVREVGFDPAGDDPEVHCNLWAGWPTTPKAGKCELLLDLLRYMCAGEGADSERLYHWVLCWLAYPIQHPGAKLKTTLVLHGPQGTGKNMFFEAIMAIYGPYGRVIDQSAIEDKFNDWASRKLFLIADEVVARSDLYHIKNKLKAFITGEWIRINPKNVAAYEERNHVNMVFLSNERMPVVLEEDDRRHAVIWTPEKLSPAFYREVSAEIADGGIAALHDYLLNYNLGEFTPSTLPPMTKAKAELIGLSLDSTARFFGELMAGDVVRVVDADGRRAVGPVLSQDLYDLYRAWCARIGTKAAPMPKLVDAFARKHRVPVERKRYMDGINVRGPHSIAYLPGGPQQPPGQSEQAWLGDCVEAFRNAVKDYKGFANGL